MCVIMNDVAVVFFYGKKIKFCKLLFSNISWLKGIFFYNKITVFLELVLAYDNYDDFDIWKWTFNKQGFGKSLNSMKKFFLVINVALRMQRAYEKREETIVITMKLQLFPFTLYQNSCNSKKLGKFFKLLIVF